MSKTSRSRQVAGPGQACAPHLVAVKNTAHLSLPTSGWASKSQHSATTAAGAGASLALHTALFALPAAAPAPAAAAALPALAPPLPGLLLHPLLRAYVPQICAAMRALLVASARCQPVLRSSAASCLRSAASG